MRVCKNCNALVEDDMMFCPECGVKYVKLDNQVYHSDDCPVIIVEQEIFLDDDELKGSITFANIGNKEISACLVVVKCRDQFEDDVECVKVKYLDLSVNNGETFGGEHIFAFSDSSTKNICVQIEKIVFADGTMKQLDTVEFQPTNQFDHLKAEETERISTRINVSMEAERKNAEAVECWEAMVELQNQIIDLISAREKEWDKAEKQFKLEHPEPTPPSYELLKTSMQLYKDFEAKYNKEMRRYDRMKSETCAKATQPYEQKIMELRVKKGAILSKYPDLVIPEGVTTIPGGLFMVKKNDSDSDPILLKSVTIPSTVVTIGKNAFAGFRVLDPIFLPESVESIKDFSINVGPAKVVMQDDFYNKWVKELKEEFGGIWRDDLLPDTFIPYSLYAYWEEHLDEKRQLESEYCDLDDRCEELAPLWRTCSEKIRECEDRAEENILNQISKLREELSTLGIFKGNKKENYRLR